jgi:hypothetical protein
MWWNGQNLDARRTDKTGRVWHFRVWHGDVEGKWIQRIFYWDDAKNETGIVELSADQTLHISRLKQLITKLIASPEFRSRYQRQIEFPVDRKYAVYAELTNRL